jgi:DNA polymerase III epsilon subunit family exonuclease
MRRVLPSLFSLRRVPVVFMDTETTGASPRLGARVTELALARYEDGVLTSSFQKLVDPQCRIPRYITELTGITQQMVDGQPTFAAHVDQLIELTRGAVVVGHNVLFDVGFIASEFDRAARCFQSEFLPGVTVLDTVRIARKQLGRGGNGLQKLAARFGVEVATAHRALADCFTTAAVFERLIPSACCWDLSIDQVLTLQGGEIRTLGKYGAGTKSARHGGTQRNPARSPMIRSTP